MARGSLRIYLGASPGVGKTYAMLNEGFRRAERGTDVVVGVVETHGRVSTAAQVRTLEVVPRARVEYRDTVLEEMDIDAVLERRPQVVLVDEFAHTNAPGSRHEKRWQDVEELLDAGIDVISTLNIQHLESLNDVVGRITGTQQRETVPDAIVRRADQVELVDMSPEAIRRRMAHGNIYPADRIDAALSNYFRAGNLGALRELALLWVANRVEESLSVYLADHGITEAWETRERVVVGITGAPSGDVIIRRAARIAGRVGGDLIGVHILSDDGLRSEQGGHLAQQRRLVSELGGRVLEVVGTDRAAALVACARAEKATQLVLGASSRSRWFELWHGSLVAKVARLASDIDVHVIARDADSDVPSAVRSDGESRIKAPRPRLAVAWLLTIVGLPLLTMATAPARGSIRLETELLLYLAAVLFIAVLGGRLVAAVAAIEASLLANWFFVEPIHTFTIAEPENIVAIAIFLAAGITVGTLVDVAARRSGESRRARVEAEALARAAATLAADPDPLPGLLEQLRLTFGFRSVGLDEKLADGWHRIADADQEPADGAEVSSADGHSVELATGAEGVAHRILFVGRHPSGDDQRVLRALLDQLAVALESRRLVAEAGEVEMLTTMDTVRTALLRAVSHDLRTPLSSIKAMVSGLLDESVEWSPVQVTDALKVVDEETDRLNRLVGNLLDASRLQIGTLAMSIADVDIADVIAQALHSVGRDADSVAVDVAADLPAVRADGALLERSLANIVSNALKHGGSEPPRLSVGAVGSSVHLCVIDRGPGIPVGQRSRVTEPFQRLGDEHSAVEGVGLGLSIAQGFVNAMGGEMALDDTPGGGLTVTIVLPISAATPNEPDRDSPPVPAAGATP